MRGVRKMERLVIECEVVTPMFLGGADGKSVELRASSIKGALRFWWRAMHGDLDTKDLYKKECEIFGGGGDKATRSAFSIRIINKKMQHIKSELLPHKPFMKADAFAPKERFTVILVTKDSALLQKIVSIFILSTLLGGFGKRVRRGMGSIKILTISNHSGYKSVESMQEIFPYIESVNPGKFKTSGNNIISDFKNNNPYPYIKKIEMGRPDIQLLKKISYTTHKIKASNSSSYEPSLGHAYKGRFASPVYVSTLQTKRGLCPIITTLNAAPNRDKHKINNELQEEFKRNIL